MRPLAGDEVGPADIADVLAVAVLACRVDADLGKAPLEEPARIGASRPARGTRQAITGAEVFDYGFHGRAKVVRVPQCGTKGGMGGNICHLGTQFSLWGPALYEVVGRTWKFSWIDALTRKRQLRLGVFL